MIKKYIDKVDGRMNVEHLTGNYYLGEDHLIYIVGKKGWQTSGGLGLSQNVILVSNARLEKSIDKLTRVIQKWVKD